MNTNVDGAIITPEAIQTVKFLQQENYVDETLNQINEVIDIVIAEDIPAILDSDKDCLRYCAQPSLSCTTYINFSKNL